MMFMKINQRSKKEPPHNRDGTPCGEITIPYIDFIWSCARRKNTQNVERASYIPPLQKLCHHKQQSMFIFSFLLHVREKKEGASAGLAGRSVLNL